MEWLNKPNTNLQESENPERICVLSLIGGGIVGCGATGLLCDSFCLIKKN
ncbi:MAG: hypothetical protein ACRDCB_07995 [Clostridium sp.]